MSSGQRELMNLKDITKCSDGAWWLLCCLCPSSKVWKGRRKENDQAKRELDPLQGWECSCRCRGCHPQAILSKHSILNILHIQLLLQSTQNVTLSKQNIPSFLNKLDMSSTVTLLVTLTHKSVSEEGRWFEEGCRGYHLVNAHAGRSSSRWTLGRLPAPCFAYPAY